MLTVETARIWLSLFIGKLEKNEKYLNTLDESIGDGDHQGDLLRGAKDLKAKLAEGLQAGGVRSVQNGWDVFHPENGWGSRTTLWASLSAYVGGFSRR